MPAIELLSPVSVVTRQAAPLAVRVPTLSGRVVGLLDNSKSGTRPFLDRVQDLLETIARAVAVSGSNNMFMSQEVLIVLGPEHAAIAARQGFDKDRVRRTLFEHARIPLEQIGQSNADVLAVWRGNCIEERDGQRTLRMVEKPEIS